MTLEELRTRIDVLDLGFREIAASEGPLWQDHLASLRRESQARAETLGLDERSHLFIEYLYYGGIAPFPIYTEEASRILAPLTGIPAEAILQAYDDAVVVPWYEARYAGEVYLAQTPDGLVKIGFSVAPEGRVRQMRSKHRGIQLVHVIETNVTIFLEHMIHRRFSEYHVRTEWFRLPDAEIESVCQVGSIELQAHAIHQCYRMGIGACICRPWGLYKPAKTEQNKGDRP
jgi:hypothetical protein